jgi:hypothetical protein
MGKLISVFQLCDLKSAFIKHHLPVLLLEIETQQFWIYNSLEWKHYGVEQIYINSDHY